MLRKSLGITLVLLTLAALAVPRPAAAFSLLSLDPSEREAMLSTCGRLGGEDQTLCRNVVDDDKVIANYKRSCLEAFTLLMRGTAWSRVRGLPPAMTCREGLRRAGYPVQDIIRKLAALM